MTIHLRLNDYKSVFNNKTLYTKAYRVSNSIYFTTPPLGGWGAITSCRPCRRHPLVGQQEHLQDHRPIQPLLLTT
jgi:hypothetical protein